MPFKYSQTEKNKIIFTPLSAGCSSGFAISIGTLFFGIGCCLVYFSKDNEMPFTLFKYMFPFFGLLAIWAGIQLPKTQKKNIPDQIIFDNSKGRVEITQSVSEVQNAFIYYDEIVGFIVIRQSHTSTNSKGSTSRTTYSYHVHLLRKDTGTWELLIENSQAEADLQIQKLNALIDFSSPPVKEALKVVFANKFEIIKNRGNIEINWQNSQGYQPVILGFIIVFFITIFWAIFGSFKTHSFSNNMDTFSYVFNGIGIFIACVFAYVLGANILKMIKNATTIYTIQITQTQLNYLEKSKSGEIKHTKTFEKNEIHAVSYSFESTDRTRYIDIYTHEQFQKKAELKQRLSFDSIKDNYLFQKNLLSIELQNLTPVETLYIENFIQAAVFDDVES